MKVLKYYICEFQISQYYFFQLLNMHIEIYIQTSKKHKFRPVKSLTM